MDTFRIGAATVHRIEEWSGNFAAPEQLLAGCTAEEFAAWSQEFAPAFYDPACNMIHACLQSWVVEVAGLTVLFDTGAGNDKLRPGIPVFGGLQTPFLARLHDSGFRPEDIDLVVCSHLHIDHVGWNTRLQAQRWVPTFPRALYLLPRVDDDYWNPANAARFPRQVGRSVNAGVYEDSVAPVIDAGQARLVDGHHEICEGLTLFPAPGHTPGHVVMHLQSQGEHALFVGDVLHHPAQIYRPQWNSVYCEDAPQARSTRLAVLERAARLDALLVPAHFGGAHACRVRGDGDGFRPHYL